MTNPYRINPMAPQVPQTFRNQNLGVPQTQPQGNNYVSVYTPATGAAPVAIGAPGVPPARDPEAALRPIYDRFKNDPRLQPLDVRGQFGGDEEAALRYRKEGIDALRDALIKEGPALGVNLALHVKRMGPDGKPQYSNDAFDWIKPDGTVAVIDFARASKDVSKGPPAFQWLDVTHSGGASSLPFDDLLGQMSGWMKDIFVKLIRELGGNKGLGANADRDARESALAAARQGLIAAGKQAGVDINAHLNADGTASLDKVDIKGPDGVVKVIQFAQNAKDLTKDVQLVWPGQFGLDTQTRP
jgi:hypothetical protein